MIILGADHGGFELKEHIKQMLAKKGYSIVDVGAFEMDENDDFSHFVRLMCNAFDKATCDASAERENECGEVRILAFCGSGVGVNIGLNKHKDVFCAVGHSKEEVEKARMHNGINALALGGRVTTKENAEEMVEAFLTTDTLGGKYARRMQELCL